MVPAHPEGTVVDNVTSPIAIGVLLLVFAVAVGLGLLIHKVEVRKGIIDHRDRRLVGDGMNGALGFLGGSAAFLLGVLMLASVDHYNATDDIVTAEALHYSSAFDSTAGLGGPDQAKTQRDLVCLMRSVTSNSWKATQTEDLTGSENTHAWRRRAIADANAIEPKTTVEENSVGTLQAELIEASRSGQERLLAADSDLPLALWGLVYVSVFVLALVLTVLLRPYPVLTITTLSAILVLSAAMVWTLTAFAEPFSQDDGVYISPRALEAVMVRLQGSYPGPAWGPCEALADS